MEHPNDKLCPNCESWVEKEAILKRKLGLLEREGSQNRKIIRQLAREVKRVHVEKGSVATSLYRTESAVSDADTIGSVVGLDEVGDSLSLTDELGDLKMAVLSLRERQDNSLSASSASKVLLRQLLSAVAVVSEACNTMATGTRYTQAQNVSEFPTISNGKNGPQGSGNQLALLQDRPGSRQLSESSGRQLVVARPDARDEFLPEVSWEALVSQSLQNVPRDEENLMHAVLQASGDCRNFLNTLECLKRSSRSAVTTAVVPGGESLTAISESHDTSAVEMCTNDAHRQQSAVKAVNAQGPSAGRPGSMTQPYSLSTQAFQERKNFLMEWDKGKR